MFGFVTFVYPETVKLILAKGNPHFVCDARVLVKPYKEKGKVPDKFRCILFLYGSLWVFSIVEVVLVFMYVDSNAESNSRWTEENSPRVAALLA